MELVASALNKHGQIPLHLASDLNMGMQKCAKLLNYGVSMHLMDNNGRYALTNAFSQDHEEVIWKQLDARFLEEYVRSNMTSSINAEFEFGRTPLHVVVAMLPSNQFPLYMKLNPKL